MKADMKKLYFLQGILGLVIIALNILDIVNVYQTFGTKVASGILTHAIPFFALCLCVIFFSFAKWRLSLIFAAILAISNLPSIFSTLSVISSWSLWKISSLGFSGVLKSLSFPGEVECIVNLIFLATVIIGLFYLTKNHKGKQHD